MKKHLFTSLIFFVLAMVCTPKAIAQSFNPGIYSGWLTTPDNYFDTVPAAPGVTFTQITRGIGNQFSTATDGINSGKWQDADANSAITNERYFTFAGMADNATTFTIDSLLFILGRTSTGPDSCLLQYKAPSTGYMYVPVNAQVYTILNPSVSATTSLYIVPDAPISVTATDSVVFRLVGWHASSSLGKMKIMNNTEIFGSSTPVNTNSINAPFIQNNNAVCVSTVVGDSVSVTFSAAGTFNSGNVYSLELSDASGSFATPQVIGTLNSDQNSVAITGYVPAGTTNGSAYQLRVTSSDPAVTGMDTTVLTIHPGLMTSIQIQDPSCPDSAGSIDLTVTGGSGVFNYAWSNNATTEDLTGLSAGNYAVTVSDAAGCLADTSAQIQTVADFAVTASQTDISCYEGTNGSVSVVPGGGTAPYTISWTGNGISASGDQVQNLAAGMYTMTLLDANNCPYTENYTLTEPDSLMATETLIDALCNGSADGSISLVIDGGTAPYTISWTGNGTSASGDQVQNLSAGMYDMILTDANNCMISGTYEIEEPDALGMTASIDQALCSSCFGTITLTVNGGIGSYSYNWDNNTSMSFVSGTPGTYCVEVTDNNGCAADSCFQIVSTAGLEAYAVSDFTGVFPNPATDKCVFVFNGAGTAKEIRVLDATGKVVLNDRISALETAYLLETSVWSEGTYMYRITDENGRMSSGKLIVIR